MMTSRDRRRLIVAALLLALLLFLPGRWLDASQYSAFTAGVQALGVLTALYLGYRTLLADWSDKRVDRALGMHAELTSGEMGAARMQVVREVRAATDGVAPLTPLNRLHLSGQPPTAIGTTYEDVAVLLRFFERVDGARLAGSLDPTLAAALIGPHARWWDAALVLDPAKARQPLHDFATWATAFAYAHRDDPRFTTAGSTTSISFPNGPMPPPFMVR